MPTSPTQSPLTHKPQFGISQFGPLQRGKQKQASVPLLAEPTAPCPLQIEFSGKGTASKPSGRTGMPMAEARFA